jgi:hypothetical protein
MNQNRWSDKIISVVFGRNFVQNLGGKKFAGELFGPKPSFVKSIPGCHHKPVNLDAFSSADLKLK